MSNSLNGGFAEIWSKKEQITFNKTNVATRISEMIPKATLSWADTFNRPYNSELLIQSSDRTTDLTIDDITVTNEALSINQEYSAAFWIHMHDNIQLNYNSALHYGEQTGIKLSNQVDADILGEYTNATSKIDDTDINNWDTADVWFTLTSSNVTDVFTYATEKLATLDVPVNNPFAVISPQFERVLISRLENKDTLMWDSISRNGYIGNYLGYNLFRSNQLWTTASLYMATDPSNTNTIIINGVTFTAVTSIWATAGNFLVGSNADTSRAVLAAFINDPWTTSSNQIALSTANQRKIMNCTATNTNSTDILSIVYKGVGKLTVSETLDAGVTGTATDGWTSNLQVQHNLFGVMWGTTVVIQKYPIVDIRKREAILKSNYLNSVLYGYKTFLDWKKKLVDVQIRADSF